MRKILLALNAGDVKASGIDFASYIANLTSSVVRGVFLENNFKEAPAEALISQNTEAFEPLTSVGITENIHVFENRCLHNDSRYSIHRVNGNPVKEMIRESLFADIVLADGNLSFTDYGDGWPSGFVKELLENAKCPVIITPFNFDEINEIVFAYDGTDSSIFAMKQFIYLFPEFNETKITVLQVLKDQGDDITEQTKLKELLMMYYSAVHYDTLHGDANMELFKKFLGQKNKLLVMGAYGRKKFLTRSTADILLKTINLPIFITHCQA